MIPLMYSRCLTVKRTYFERSSGLKVDRETRSKVNYFFRSVLEIVGEIALEKGKDDIAPSKLTHWDNCCRRDQGSNPPGGTF